MELISFHPFPRYAIHVGAGDDPLSWATLAALYSRSRDSAEEALDKAKSAKKRMIETYYIGYGHDSIGDLVDVRLFLEGVPMWFAFLIEHHSRFRGQESSTRYIDFSSSKATAGNDDWYDGQIVMYKDALAAVRDGIENDPIDWITTEESPKIIEAAMNARAFDICRGLLPVQAPTNVAWFGSIQQMRGHLAWLKWLEIHGRDVPPLSEWVDPIIDALNEVYPETKPTKDVRPHIPYDEVPPSALTFALESSLDFGSLRDLHRHRPGCHSKPDVWRSTKFHPWYLEKMGQYGAELEVQGEHGYKTMSLGHVLDFTYTTNVSRWQYIFALRTKPTVHPTLRHLLQETYRSLYPQYQRLLELDMSPDLDRGFYLHRGTQTIEVK